MVDLLTGADVVARSNGTVDAGDLRLGVYVSDVLGQAYLAAPCLRDVAMYDTYRPGAVGILAEAVLRRFRRDDDPRPDVQRESQTAGSFGLMVDRGSRDGLPLLTRADRDQLAALCPAVRTAGSLRYV